MMTSNGYLPVKRVLIFDLLSQFPIISQMRLSWVLLVAVLLFVEEKRLNQSLNYLRS